MWDQTRHALEFFHRYLPFARMQPENELISSVEGYCLAHAGEVYAVYLLDGGNALLEVGPGTYVVRWYDPLKGGALQQGSITRLQGPGRHSLGTPPGDRDQDWAVLVCRPSFLRSRSK
jgi:hypothetical protein